MHASTPRRGRLGRLAPGVALVCLAFAAPSAWAGGGPAGDQPVHADCAKAKVSVCDPPVTTANPGAYTPGTWTNAASVGIAFTASQDDGPTTTYYAIDDPSCASDSSVNCSTGTTATVTGDGQHTVTFFSGNAYGFEPTQTLAVWIDTAAPQVSCPFDEFKQFLLGDAFSFTASVSDDLSGPATPSHSYAETARPIGVHEITVTGSDVAGNVTTSTCHYVAAPQFLGFRPHNGQTFSRKQPIAVSVTLADVHGNPLPDAAARRLARHGQLLLGIDLQFVGLSFAYHAKTNTFTITVPARSLTKGEHELAAVLVEDDGFIAFADSVIHVTA